jgi:signal-transduction protein with cAMP-binding, CBS, and nucleotidyltransferase domain
MIQARSIIAAAILAQQLRDLAAGAEAGNRIDPGRLTRAQRRELKEALRQAGDAGTLVQDVLTS